MADELGGFMPKGGVAEQALKGVGKAMGVIDIGVNMIQGTTNFQA